MAMQNIFNILVDLKVVRSINQPLVTQNDSVVFILEVVEDGVPFDLTDTTTVSLAHTRRDGTVVVTPGTKDGNKATFELGTNETAVAGGVIAKAQFYDGEGRVSTLSFGYTVGADPTGADYVPSVVEQTLIETVLNDGPLIIQSAEDAAAYATAQGDYVETKRPLIETFTGEQTNLQTQLNDLVLQSGTDIAEVVQARGGEVTLNARLNVVNQQLIESENKSFNAEVQNKRYKKPMLVIIDDDTNPKLYTHLYPLVLEYGIKINAALISDRVDTVIGCSLGQIKEMAQNGVDFINHTHTHSYLGNLATEAEVENDIATCAEWLEDNGFVNGSKYIVYPFGSVNSTVFKVARKYNRAGVISDNNINYPPLSSMNLSRYDWDNNTLEGAKAKIDEAISTNGLLILASHAGFPDWDQLKMRQTIEYAITQGIEIVTLDEAMNQVGNILEFVDGSGTPTLVDAEGNVHGNKLGKVQFMDTTSVIASTPITDYPNRCISIGYLTSVQTSTAGFVIRTPIVITTFRNGNDLYSYQEIKPVNSDISYIRNWDSVANAWGITVLRNSVLIDANDSVTFASAPTISASSTLNRQMRVIRISATYSAAQGFPTGKAGVLYYYPLGTTTYPHQIFINADGDVFIRMFKSDSTWGVFRKFNIGSIVDTTKALTAQTVNANSTVDISVASSAFILGYQVLVTPLAALPLNIGYSVFVNATGTAILRLINPTGASISVNTMDWKFKIIE